MPDIRDLPFTIDALRGAYGEGLDPRTVAAETLRRLAAAGDPGIFISVAGPAELEAAAAALGVFDPARPLWGIPSAVKDNIDVVGFPTTAACPAFSYRPAEDAEAVARLRAAGALIVGKTNLDQFATGLVGVRTPYAIPRNPLDPRLVPGGSSSGSAVAVARGIVAIALGTDTAGSGRVPAAFNNIVGLKPSVGAVSNRGVVPACRTLDCVSTFALTVEDAWTSAAAIAGYDALDPFSRRLTMARAAVPARPKVGVPRPADRAFSDPQAAAAYEAAVAAAEALGAVLVQVDFDAFFAVGTLLYGGPWVAERFAAIRGVMEDQGDAILPVIREIIAGGARISAADAFDAVYRLRALARRTEAVWDEVDLLCVPTVPGQCTVEEVEHDPFAANARLGVYTNFVNLLDLSALAVPAGRRADGGAAGVTLIGRSGADGLLAAFGRGLHRATTTDLGATGWPLPPGTWPDMPAVEGGIPLMVFGAHLSGLPLNGELARAGAVFHAEALTAPDYRLHALDGPVPRPALVRVPPGRGVAVAGEIWLLPPDGFGRFVAAVPPPLAIGTVRLATGGTVKGFLAEGEGVGEAPDISRHGGWRAYLSATARQAETAG